MVVDMIADSIAVAGAKEEQLVDVLEEVFVAALVEQLLLCPYRLIVLEIVAELKEQVVDAVAMAVEVAIVVVDYVGVAEA